MKWITTNIRFPEDLYMELKMAAAKQRTSVAQIIRERVTKKKQPSDKSRVKQLLREFDQLAKENDRQNSGISFSEKLIEMRYEQ